MPTKSLPLLALFGLLIAAGGCSVTDRQIIDQADSAHSGLKPAVITDRQLADYIQAVGDRVVNAAAQADKDKIGPDSHFKDDDREWMFSKRMQFHFVNSKTLNAFTTGGEHMYVYTALLDLCQDETDLAAVIAHEYAHVYCRHVQKGTQRQYGIIGLALAAGAAGAVAGGKEHYAEYGTAAGGAALAVGQLAGTQFTSKDEAEADKFGFYFYTRAGWDPNKFGHFFQLMIDKGYDKGSSMLSDHPPLANRVKAADAAAKKLGSDVDKYNKAPVASTSEFNNIKSAAARVAKTMPDDKSLAKTQELLQALPRSCLTPAIQEDQVTAQKQLQKDLEAEDRQKSSKK